MNNQNLFTQIAHFKMIPLAGDASSRRYTRLIPPTNQKSLILCEDESIINEKFPFAVISEIFFKHHIHVPQVLAIDAKNHRYLQEDVGDVSLNDIKGKKQRLKFYLEATKNIVKIQKIQLHQYAEAPFNHLFFDKEKYAFEFQMSQTYLVEKLLGLVMPAEVKSFFAQISTLLSATAMVLCHRDYHGRNIYIHEQQVFLIDFQDARFGPITYDLVSLLEDCYVAEDEEFQEIRKICQEQFCQDFKIAKNHFLYLYEISKIQRIFKACGSFAFLYSEKKKPQYLPYLPLALDRLIQSCEAKIINPLKGTKEAQDFLIRLRQNLKQLLGL
jgi:aminoglycoside/choline kinase family phosphotransferase